MLYPFNQFYHSSPLQIFSHCNSVINYQGNVINIIMKDVHFSVTMILKEATRFPFSIVHTHHAVSIIGKRTNDHHPILCFFMSLHIRDELSVLYKYTGNNVYAKWIGLSNIVICIQSSMCIQEYMNGNVYNSLCRSVFSSFHLANTHATAHFYTLTWTLAHTKLRQKNKKLLIDFIYII